MTTVTVRTKDNQLIEKLIVDTRYSQDDQAEAYTLSVINEAIRDALSIDSGALVTPFVSSFDPDCACTPLIDEPCSYCQEEEEKES